MAFFKRELEYVDLDCGRIYFIRGVHPAAIWRGRKRACIKSYLKIKEQLEQALNLSMGLAIELILRTEELGLAIEELKKYKVPTTADYFGKFGFSMKDLEDYFILKCIKENKDLYFCDVVQSPSKLRDLASVIIPAALFLEVLPIAGLAGGPVALFVTLFYSGMCGTVNIGFAHPAKRIMKIFRGVRHIMAPILVMIDKFREITTAIQLKAILEQNLAKYGEKTAITYWSHGGHTDNVMKYVRKPIAELQKELDKLVQIEKVYKTYFRPPVRIPTSELTNKEKTKLLLRARAVCGFDLDII